MSVSLHCAVTDHRLPEAERPGREIGHAVLWHDAVDSTNRRLADLGRAGAAHGTVLAADHQTAGSGKGDRVWFSKPGGGLCLSVLLRPEARTEDLPQLTLLTAVAVLDALFASGIAAARVKWPNDILVDGRKVCGILAEGGVSADGSGFVVIGVGLNVNLTANDFPLDLREVATSLAAVAGRPLPRRRIFQDFLAALEGWLAIWRELGFSPIADAWSARSCTLGRRVAFDATEESVEGEAVGLGRDGCLLVRDGSGATHRFHSGEMRFVPSCAAVV